jgi:predicted amidohydrolase
MMWSMKVALVQMVSSNNLRVNLDKMRCFFEAAVQQGADIVVFPEMAYFTGSIDDCGPIIPQYKKVVAECSEWARKAKVMLLPGSMREPSENDGGKPFNTIPVIDGDGRLLVSYRKIFLFKAALSDRSYDETKQYAAGNAIVTVSSPKATFGLSICFDLRFPELFRALRKRGVQMVFLPAAFTVPTGKVHWHTLLTARAIENQCFVLAPGLVGLSGDGSEKYGHTLAVSPWGERLLDMEHREGVGLVDIALNLIPESAQRVDPWSSRREDLFPIG